MGDDNAKHDQDKGSFSEDYEVDYITNKYGLTKEQARGIVREHKGNRDKIDAAAGEMRAHRRK